ncbi:helicase [Geitlerinema sp. PCC 7407]|uniref:helicase n=1 Tax=Geitlerinema sp. PCC 7407 TaxID=1173025 RepID=UPI00029FD74A|nr:helicase [Geitlerinema sp. PCC 7407]AFY66550.1 helicase domain-containing protein [Geitlerinema sp. PCC 7407]
MEDNFLVQASTWGRIFEIAVQRGVIAQLIYQKLLSPAHPALEPWHTGRVSDVTKGALKALSVTDDNVRDWLESGVRHLLIFGYGLGWTTMRECLKHDAPKNPKLEALWCPLTLPGKEDKFEEEQEKTAIAFHQAFQLSGPPDAVTQKGSPGKADFLLWLKSDATDRRRSKRSKDFLLCLEFSYNAPAKLADFKTEAPHCAEVNRYARYLDSRGVFARVCAEVEGETLTLSHKLADHLVAFSGSDKPLYKLCQAASYTEKLVRQLSAMGRFSQGCNVRAIAVTSNGLESLAAHFNGQKPEPDPRARLMTTLGQAYRKARSLSDDAPDALKQEIQLVFRKLLGSLPTELKNQVKPLLKSPDPGQLLHFNFQEQIGDFSNPTQLFSVEDVISGVQLSDEFIELLGNAPEANLRQALISRQDSQEQVTLRDAHAAAVVAGLKAAQPGRLNVLALEGNPGIGKTTAVTQFLAQQEGYCFLYVSPRVVINRDVTNKLARDKGRPTGILTMTSNAKLIDAAPEWYDQQSAQSGQKSRRVDSAVVVDGISNLVYPTCNTIFVSPEDEQNIDTSIVTSRRYKRSRNEREDSVQSQIRPGVLRTLATSARKLLEHNPAINRIVMTAAIQGYRGVQNRTTIDALSNLFTKKANLQEGKRERQIFAQKIPTIIAMVDEVAGDGAGALFCHRLAEWLHQQFLEPFEGEPCPFRVVLIISDASLSNEVVLNSYLNSGERAPDKVLISPTQGNSAFRVTGTRMKVGPGRHPVLHVMTNSYPASQLKVDYSVRLAPITPGLTSDGLPQSIRQAIRDQSAEKLLNNARIEIERGLANGAEQLIFFAQDKAFLRQLCQNLTLGDRPVLAPEKVKVIDQSVPEAERLKLVQEPQRDQVRVFLMTSSGARGVSFPKTDWIIASIPRFNIEAALMEVAQLIYRGRGSYTDATTGEPVPGDNKSRQLVMLINDFVIDEGTDDRDRRWLRQASDLLTLLLMLRSTIHTRIKGDAGLRRQRIAFVPVGFVGDEELLSLMSGDLRDFLREAQVFICDAQHPDDKALVAKAAQLTERLFGHFNLRGMSPERGAISYVDYGTTERLAKALTRPASRLLALSTPTEMETLVIPEKVTCIGPFWMEDWKGRNSEEKFSFETWRKGVKEGSSSLLEIFQRIKKNKALPSKLRRPAQELYRLLIREKDAATREYSTLQDTRTDNLVIALPLDYPHFWQKSLEDGIRQQEVEDPNTWRDALGRALASQGTVMPVVAKYQDFPWAAVVGQRTMSQLDLIFDNRYFMASSEMNLLNTLLLEDD